ncbi:MAG TPA: JAB domain-containing protein [Verrucomicrobiae bacterium]|nr:JAB domain-containing protein [Verrucomicrobiae bacterium]
MKAAQIHAAIEIGVRLARQKAAANKLDDASRIAELVGPEMRVLPAESARVVLLNAKLHLIAVEEVSRGLVQLQRRRGIFDAAIKRQSANRCLTYS